MLELIGTTLKRIFALYLAFPRKLFELGIYVALGALIFGASVTALLFYAIWSFGAVPPHLNIYDITDLFHFWYYLNGLEMLTGFVLLFYGLFAVRMRELGERAIAELSFAEFWRSLTPNNWSSFFMAFLIFFIIGLVLFKPLFDHDRSGWGYFMPSGNEDPMTISKSGLYMAWINNMIRLLRNQIPYFLVLYLLLADRRTALTWHTLKALAPVVGAILILAIVMDSLTGTIIHFVGTYILPPFTIPFAASLIPLVFTCMVVLVIMAATIPAVALSILGPLDAWTASRERPEPATLGPMPGNDPDEIIPR